MIAPTFNRVSYLDEALGSIPGQDYRDFELVVADNASTDGTAALLAGVQPPDTEVTAGAPISIPLGE